MKKIKIDLTSMRKSAKADLILNSILFSVFYNLGLKFLAGTWFVMALHAALRLSSVEEAITTTLTVYDRIKKDMEAQDNKKKDGKE